MKYSVRKRSLSLLHSLVVTVGHNKSYAVFGRKKSIGGVVG